MTSAAVFAYHNVGLRCLSVLLAHGVKVPLVVTHEDNPNEQIWFESVAEFAKLRDIAVITPADPNRPEVVERITALKSDFLFSFYYRHMLKPELLAIPRRGALNMHGSLLPQFRGRVPVNWAVIKGATETGATLHYMEAKPDAGDIVDQEAVPILPDDTAMEVFHKVTCAAEVTLNRCLPALLAGTAPRIPQDLTKGAYFGGRKPQDGEIDWRETARDIHNLVRGVAPPYPGAFTGLRGRRVRILKTLREPERAAPVNRPALYCEGERCYAACGDGQVLRIVEMEFDGKPVDAEQLESIFGSAPIPLETKP